LEKHRHSGLDVAGGPYCVAINEQIRRKAGGSAILGPSLPTDVFVLGIGEPKQRDVTKIGGVPFRPAKLRWPSTTEGPMTFLVQYQFAQSKDIVGDVPGDVLLVFTTERHLYAEAPCFRFEWHSSEIDELVKFSDVPRSGLEFVSCFGVRHRTVDYLDDSRALRAIESVVTDKNLTADDGELSNRRAYRNNGLKIGGAPFWLNEDDPRLSSIKGRFLCSLTHVCPYAEIPYPWINVPSPLPLNVPAADEWLYWFDGFTLNFFIEKNGRVRFYAQFM
jgi:hypothetical protein